MAKRSQQQDEAIAPVRLYSGDDRRLPRMLKGALETERARESDALIRGMAKDFADYRFRVGKVQALSSAIQLCQEFMDDLAD